MKKDTPICFVLSSLTYGGAELQTINHINFLHKKGYAVTLLILSHIIEEDLFAKIALPAADIKKLNFNYNTLTGKAILKSWAVIFSVMGFIKARNIKVVVANLPLSHFVLRAAKILSVVFLFRSFGLVIYQRSLQYEANPLNTLGKKAFNAFNSFLAFLADSKTIFISSACKENISAHFFVRQPVIIYNSIPYRQVGPELAAAYFAENAIDSRKKILLPGRLHLSKGQFEFLEAFAAFVTTNNILPADVKLVLAGNGTPEYQQKLEEKAARLQLSDHVHFTGGIPNDLMLSFYQKADFTVIPSIHEGLGNVAIEGLMQGALILASTVGGLKEVVIDGTSGFSYDLNDMPGLLHKLQGLYTGTLSINREALKQHYRSHFTLEAQMAKILQVLELPQPE